MSNIKPKSERQEIFGESKSGYLWCLHCERAYPDGEYREVKSKSGVVYQMCPYEDCDGNAVIDAWDWAQISEGHPEYPETPKKGKVYPQYS